MSNDQTAADDAPLDPKEQMRAALEAKKAGAHTGENHADGKGKLAGGPHGQAAAKRVFRRKSGG